jgi:MoxR-like ATPase
VARELRLGGVLRWPVTSRTTLRSGLYEYDAIGRAQATSGACDGTTIGDYIHLGPLGTALLPRAVPRVLLIDEMDRCSVDLPADLREVIEEGQFSIPELVRVRNLALDVTVHTADSGETAVIRNGVVRCHEFPIMVITSNDERGLPDDFRCVRYDVPEPDDEWLAAMVAAHFPAGSGIEVREMIRAFREHGDGDGGLTADTVLNAVHLTRSLATPAENGWDSLLDAIWRHLPEQRS